MVALDTLRASVNRLRDLVAPLDDDQVQQSAYPTEWTIADVMSHIGSGAVIMQRRLDDGIRHEAIADEFPPSVWNTWNAKSPRAKVDDGLVADRAFVDRIDALRESERAEAQISMGPLTFGVESLVAFRLNEHVLHSWDIAVSLDPKAVIPPDSVDAIIDNLELIARFSAKPTGDTRRLVVHTTDPSRAFAIDLAADAVTLQAAASGDKADLVLPAEAWIRLVYGRLDPDHAPAVANPAGELELLRQVFPGP